MLDDIHELKSLVDFRTVQLLQTRNPWASTTDNAIVSDLMHTHVLFPMIIEPEVRSRILSNIQTTDCIIPSLYTFFEDTKWLEPCAKTLRNLLPTNCRLSTHESMFLCLVKLALSGAYSVPIEGNEKSQGGRERASCLLGTPIVDGLAISFGGDNWREITLPAPALPLRNLHNT